jgi:hypothetical protein
VVNTPRKDLPSALVTFPGKCLSLPDELKRLNKLILPQQDRSGGRPIDSFVNLFGRTIGQHQIHVCTSL